MESCKGSQVGTVVRILLGDPNPNLSSGTEFRYGTRGSLSVDLQTGIWFDHENNHGGGLIDLCCDRSGKSHRDAAEWLKSHGVVLHWRDVTKPKILETYDYRDENSTLLYQVVRYEPKSFRQRQPDPGGDWKWSLKRCRRVLYRLPELMAAEPSAIVYLVEGEKDADRLAELGLVSTTNSGGANKWRREYSSSLAGRKVVVVPDNDDAGEAHAQTLLVELSGVADEVAIVRPPELPPKGDVSDWLNAGGDESELNTLATAALAASATSGPTVRPNREAVPSTCTENGGGFDQPVPTPLPLLRTEDPATPLPLSHLGPFRSAVEAIATLTQAPTEIGLQSVLAVASVGVQGLADVQSLAGPVPTSLALLTIAQSGERKSSCDKLALEALNEVQRERVRKYETELDDHKAKAAIYEADRKAILKGSDFVEREAELKSLGSPPPAPLAPHILFGDPTIEGLLRHFDEGQPSVGVFSDEGGMLLGGHAMNSENKLKTAAAFSKLWDGAEINRARASASPKRFYGRRLAYHLMVQPGIADALLSDPMIRDQGFLSRVLLARPKSRIGFRSEASKHEKRESEGELNRFQEQVREILDLPLATNDDRKELVPRVLALGEEAQMLLSEFAAAVEVKQRPGEVFADVRGFASKAVEQAARIAAIMTIFENPQAANVPVERMADAIGLMDWYLHETWRLLDTGPIRKKTEDAELIRSWLIERYEEDEISVRTAVRKGPRRLRDTTEMKELFKKLEEFGWLVPLDREGRGGRIWKIARS